jgi:hypothetical protein
MSPAQQTLSVLDPEEVLKPWRQWLRRTGRVKAPKTRESYQQYMTEIALQVRGGKEGRAWTHCGVLHRGAYFIFYYILLGCDG